MMRFEYFNQILSLLKTLRHQERVSMEKTVNLLFDAVTGGPMIYTFGASHAGILSEELFDRTGGVMLFNPICARELMADTVPITLAQPGNAVRDMARSWLRRRRILQKGMSW